MARRGRRRSSENRAKVRRDVDTLSLAELSDDNFQYVQERRRVVEPLEIEDRRLFDPDGVFRPARSVDYASSADVVERELSSLPRPVVSRSALPRVLRAGSFPSKPARRPARQRQAVARHEFREPSKVMVCVRRKERREVLHALRRLHGRGRGKRNYWSEISCGR